MKRLALAPLFAVAILTCGPNASADDNRLTADEQAAGWRLLFDGQSLDGWMTSSGQPSRRPVEQGSLNPHRSGGYMLVYQEPQENFVLALDFKISPRCNSGVFFRTSSLEPRPGKDVGFNGLEIAIDDTKGNGYHDTGAIYDLVAPTRNQMRPVGEWNHLELTCDGSKVRVELNGVLVSRMDLDEWTQANRRPDGSQHKFDVAYRNHPRRGYIGLQDHGADCWFKNIKLKTLPGRDTMPGQLALELRRQQETPAGSGRFTRATEGRTWPAAKTAVIVCDVWDLHHCRNAVRRLEEFGPRLNEVLREARSRGATIIHSPSDCMPAYAEHPARLRAVAVPKANPLPADIESWCSRIPAEERAAYPIDQSDGGEDDDPADHAQWAAHLTSLGRNPGMPWKSQSDMITIDAQRDYISDRGDEVWSILKHAGIEHVILTGVHTNMCVLGRPFGLRQLARNGMDVVLMRDMTDTMYNPARWPYTDHFTGNDLIVSHVERYVCPTITSDQLLGGSPFRFSRDQRAERDVTSVTMAAPPDRTSFIRHWTVATIPGEWTQMTGGAIHNYGGVAWYRCTVRTPQAWIAADGLVLSVGDVDPTRVKAWCNGQALPALPADNGAARWRVPAANLTPNDANLLVLRVEHASAERGLKRAPQVSSGDKSLDLQGRWQFRLGDFSFLSNIPLPARFGIGPDILFEPK